MEIKYSPKKILNVFENAEYDNPFEGSITLKLLPAVQRIKEAKLIALEKTNEGEVELNDKDDSDKLSKIIALVRKQTVAIELKRKSNQYKIDTFEKAEYDEDATNLIYQAGKILLRGVQLGES